MRCGFAVDPSRLVLETSRQPRSPLAPSDPPLACLPPTTTQTTAPSSVSLAQVHKRSAGELPGSPRRTAQLNTVHGPRPRPAPTHLCPKMSWTTIILWIVVPWAFKQASAYFQKAPPGPKRVPRPYTRGDRISTGIFLLLALQQASLCLLYPGPNLLKDLNVPLEAPTYVLRNAFRRHMAARFPGWQEGADYAAALESQGLPPPAAQLTGQVQELERAHELLKPVSSRLQYLAVGHDAMVSCTWCVEPSDHRLYILPSIAASYVLALLALGAGTCVWRKARLRRHGILALGSMAIVDFYYLLLRSPPLTELAAAQSAFNDALLARRLAFVVLSVVAAFADEKDEPSEESLVHDISTRLQECWTRGQAFRLARAATLGNGNLRKKFMEFYKEQEAANDAIVNDVEYKVWMGRWAEGEGEGG
ncbi:hypothetical protein BDK51DRAFT_43121 [Blyttiomyces helicus]|uniref:Uncharacterized protein n=1 Tax=Blyttiomyces helicus TaxID=388810 RepID=A0A4V1ISD4_9FUNG|nr:hypothetical protein BDK51DRAFT_43121 [Blyttiomyces helicus]|eukprot:RKO93167.1 hypothetical protein BDK51DRAFT_43121 [Blyttiomyces helicus]